MYVKRTIERGVIREGDRDLGGTAVVRPGAPGGGVGLADVVREILGTRPGSANHSLQELQHACVPLVDATGEKKSRARGGAWVAGNTRGRGTQAEGALPIRGNEGRNDGGNLK